jgi:hypothetical protein
VISEVISKAGTREATREFLAFVAQASCRAAMLHGWAGARITCRLRFLDIMQDGSP